MSVPKAAAAANTIGGLIYRHANATGYRIHNRLVQLLQYLYAELVSVSQRGHTIQSVPQVYCDSGSVPDSLSESEIPRPPVGTRGK